MTNTVTIDGIEYAPVTKGGEKLHIVIVDNRGLTFIGRVDLSTPDYPKVIRDARCVINWGTSEHIAEIAINGIRPKTRLGYEADVTIYDPPILSYEVKGE